MSLRHTRNLAGRRVPMFDRIRRKHGDPMMGLDGLVPIGRHRVSVGKRRRWCYRNARRAWVWRGCGYVGTVGGRSRANDIAWYDGPDQIPADFAAFFLVPQARIDITGREDVPFRKLLGVPSEFFGVSDSDMQLRLQRIMIDNSYRSIMGDVLLFALEEPAPAQAIAAGTFRLLLDQLHGPEAAKERARDRRITDILNGRPVTPILPWMPA